MNYNFLPQLTPLYDKYNNIIKPLVAEIEVRFEEVPTSIFNEIRAFNDHISRCFLKPEDKEWINVQLNKANGHIERIILDCYKFLNVALYDKVIKEFDKSYKGVDLSTINNGEFLISKRNLTKNIILKLKKAKSMEVCEDKNLSIAIYEQVHNLYTELEDLIDENSRNLFWAKGKFYYSKLSGFVLWLFAAIISGLISSTLIPYNQIVDWIKSFFL